ncbi:Mut7-C RNAse domain-containing protein [Thermococcus thermotolerans]|uniref:Mut7-C RNAse domain-containing protein n=1 Tax=Thermococcus thermotolerans TaxID=2969672 RepID=UPI0021576290|nr:Mut7-C RNAse domain-containing protein [Thermococcus thermotolerans]
MRFIADMMLGRLARWLRLYGYDTLYGVEDDDEILRVALAENRALLTRDSSLAGRARRLGLKVILLDSNSLEGQIGELKRHGLEFRELFPPNARCPKCNGLIRPVSKGEVRGKVPESVYQKYDEFYVCETCGQIYWPGRQWREMLRIDERLRRV